AVFHDDQHGTAIVSGAALLNALLVVDKQIDSVKIVINGAGSAGIAICKFLLGLGAKNIIMVDRFGALSEDETYANSAHNDIAKLTNHQHEHGTLKDVLVGADVFIGVSVGNIVSREMVSSMANNAIVFPLANPTPEISREDALIAGAKVVGTGISNKPNQINNLLIFPGIFRGALDVRATDINEEMKKSACFALASLVTKEELNANYILPSPLDKRVAKVVAEAVGLSAIKSGVAKNIK
ncbi:MAG: NAD-dependent malic enzyme, partial [Clostridia bacterium]